MIDIKEKHNCCGCSACVQICPKQCISMSADNEGFLYPQVDSTICIDCGLCERVCPVINQNEPREPLAVYAAKNNNEEIRLKSSSGGIFTLLAEQIISEGGVVFGARFNDNWEVVHDYTETIDGLEPFRGSKYVQSVIGDNFIKAKQFLADGRKVLFTGTPCQIAGLKKFLRKDYDNLLAVDLVCHSVPSPLVWREYLKNRMFSVDNKHGIVAINFRDKSKGWKKYCFAIHTDKGTQKEASAQNLYMQGFLKDIYTRPSCIECPAKHLKSGADITLGDFWGIQRYMPDFDDDKGVSLVMINTNKGVQYFNSPKILKIGTFYEQALLGNPAIECSVKPPIEVQKQFWASTDKISVIPELCRQLRPSMVRRYINLTKRIIKKLLRK